MIILMTCDTILCFLLIYTFLLLGSLGHYKLSFQKVFHLVEGQKQFLITNGLSGTVSYLIFFRMMKLFACNNSSKKNR